MDDPISPVRQLRREAQRLRASQAACRTALSQKFVVQSVGEWAARWLEPGSRFRRRAEALTEPFAWSHTCVSLDALLASLTPPALWELIDGEQVREARGPCLVGHVIAGNTPLLAWVSVLRALLMRSASLVKLPSGPAAEWGRLFRSTLGEVSPILASTVHLAQWPGGTAGLDRALCSGVDLVVAHGSDSTLDALRALCPPGVGFVGYGHRVSFGIVPTGGATEEAARGFARDILLYDQGGCLSPQTVFVEGGSAEARAFGALLATVLEATSLRYPQPERTPLAAMRIREASQLAAMEEGVFIWQEKNLRWTVLARSRSEYTASPTHGVVSIQPLSGLGALSQALDPVAGRLQGCALARGVSSRGSGFLARLACMGVSRICAPGDLQCPPFSWRQDGKDVLGVFCREESGSALQARKGPAETLHSARV